MTEFGKTDKNLKTATKFKMSVTIRLMAPYYRVRNYVIYKICNSAGSNNKPLDSETDT